MAPSVKLTYFDLQGRGELTRLLLKAGKVDFEDCRLQFSEWPAMKPSTLFGGLPVLTWDGEEIAQQMAIVRFVARKVGLAGKTDLLAGPSSSFWTVPLTGDNFEMLHFGLYLLCIYYSLP